MNSKTEDSSSKFIIRAPKTIEEFEEYYDLRHKVLREPLGLEKGTEKARPLINELAGIHVCAFTPDESKIIGAAMGFMSKDYAKVHALCVLAEYQKLGLGRVLMNALEAKMKKRGAKNVYLNSRSDTEKFYLKIGYASVHTMTREEAIKITGMDIIFIRMEKQL